MNGYERSIYYVYCYEHGIKKDSVGYIKFEKLAKKFRITVSIKISDIYRFDSLKVYCFSGTQDGYNPMLLGEKKISSGVFTFRTEVNEKEGNNIVGIYICEAINGNTAFISCWRETDNEFWKKRIINEPESKPETEENIKKEEKCKDEEDNFFRGFERIEGLKYSGEYKCVKIQPSNIMSFPKNQWELCNNSFLLHGYYCYKYLTFMELRNEGVVKHKIGVPGIFHQNEKMMASMFGFDEFIEAENKCVRGRFGFWCKEIQFL